MAACLRQHHPRTFRASSVGSFETSADTLYFFLPLQAEYVLLEFNIVKGVGEPAVQIADYITRHDRPRPAWEILCWLQPGLVDTMRAMWKLNDWVVKTAIAFKGNEFADRAVQGAQRFLEGNARGETAKLGREELTEAFWHACASAQRVRRWEKAGSVDI